jgi:1,4-dihydroxy-2-naphthoate octaprenyltransferase
VKLKVTLKAKNARRMHLIGMAFWGLQMIAVAILMWPWDWRTYLLSMSLYANFVGHWSGYSAERPTEIENE